MTLSCAVTAGRDDQIRLLLSATPWQLLRVELVDAVDLMKDSFQQQHWQTEICPAAETSLPQPEQLEVRY